MPKSYYFHPITLDIRLYSLFISSSVMVLELWSNVVVGLIQMFSLGSSTPLMLILYTMTSYDYLHEALDKDISLRAESCPGVWAEK